MAAIVSGNTLGLGLTSLATGQAGMGTSALGRNGQQVYVNSANGNLVLQKRDDYLVSAGLDALLVRTYNSQGDFDGSGDTDNWRIGFYRGVGNLTGLAGATGSTVTRTDADGAQAIYLWDSAFNGYVNTEGAGAHDVLAFDTTLQQWNWTDGDSRMVETYDWINGAGKLIKQVDASANRVDYIYSGNLLTEVRDQSGEKVVLVYDGKNVAEVRNQRLDGSTLTRVRYGYDTLNRLASVTVDLSPDDNSIGDGDTYVTSYSYDGDSKRIAGTLESDGTQASFTYRQLGALWQIASLTQVVDGVTRSTAYAYDDLQNSPNGTATRVTDAMGNITVISSDSSGRLVKIVGPAVNGLSQSIAYTYDSLGNILTQTDGMGNISKFEYDVKGNQTKATDPMGTVVDRTFGSKNELSTETVKDLVPNISYPVSRVASYAYDARNRVRFALSAEGRVTEYRYDGFGNQTSVIQYTAQTYAGGVTESALASWVSGTADKARSQRTDISYDFRGQADKTTAWKTVSAAGLGVEDGMQIITSLIYDQAGQLTKSIMASGLVSTYTYDGLGRNLSTTDNAGLSSTTLYDDAGNKIRTTQANGLVTTSVYNRAGEMISQLQNDGNGTLGESRFWYDAGGRLRFAQSPNGAKRAMLYDAAGRQSGEIDGAGMLTEFRYDANGHRTHSIAYASAVAPLSFMGSALDLSLAENQAARELALALTLEAVRPAASALDAKTWNLYDADGRLAWQIDALGYATQTLYDGQSKVTSVNRLAKPIDTALLGDGGNVMLRLAGSGSALQISDTGTASGPNGARTYVAVVSGIAAGRVMTGTVSFFAGSVLLGSTTLHNNVATLTASNLPLGHSDITAVYSGDADNVGANSNVLGADVVAAPATSVVLNVDFATAEFGAAISLAATVSGTNPSGMVAFYSGAMAVGYAAVQNGVATLVLATLPVGQNSLSAVYLGDPANAGSTSPALAETVNIAQTSVSLTASDTTINVGVEMMLTAVVSGREPLGTVTFYGQAGQVLGTGRVIDGVASALVKNMAAGVAQVVAAYSGDARNAGSVSAALAETVAAENSFTTLYANNLETPNGTLLTLTAKVVGFNPKGMVSFFGLNDVLLGSGLVTNGYATLSLLNPVSQIGDISASYAGDANNTTSVAQPLGNARNTPAMTFTSASTVVVGATLDVSAYVGGTNVGGFVSLFDEQGNCLQTAVVDGNNIRAQLTLGSVGLSIGNHVLTLVYSGNAENVPVVKTVALNVMAAATSVALTVNTAPPKAGEPVIFTAVVSSTKSKLTVGGQVRFRNSATNAVIGLADVVDGRAAVAVNMPADATSYLAEYLGDTHFAANMGSVYISPSAADPVRLIAGLASSTAAVEQGATFTLTATIGTADGANTPALVDSWVYFYNGKTLLEKVRTSGGVAQINTALANVGMANIHVVATRYAGGPGSNLLADQAVSADVAVTVAAAARPPAQPAETRLTSTTTLSVDVGALKSVDAAKATDKLVLTAAMSGAGTIAEKSLVSFYNGDQLIGVAWSSGGVAVLTVGSLPSGAYALSAVFAGSPTFRPSESSAQSLNVALAPTSTVLRASPVNDSAKNMYTLQAQVTGPLLPTGVVKFYSGTQLLGEAPLTAGLAVLTIALPGGALVIRAEFQGTAANAASTSATVAPTVFDAGAQVVLTAGTSAIGTPLLLSARVTGTNPDGMVSFFDGNTLLGSANLIGDTATLGVSNLALGSRALRAVYSGDANNIAASSATVAATVTRPAALALTVNRTTASSSSPTRLTATFASANPGGLVSFMDGAAVLGTAAIVDGQANLDLARLPGGIHELQVVYAGDAENPSETTAAVSIGVALARSNISVTSDVATSTFGQILTLTANVQGSTPGGIVTFSESRGTNYAISILGTAEVVDGVATLVTNKSLDANTHEVRATYSGDAYNASSVTGVLTQVVTAAPSPVTLRTSLSPVPYGDALLLVATVPKNGVGARGGSVSFYDGTTLLQSVSVDIDGVAQLTTRSLAVGQHALRVTYTGDSYNMASASVGTVAVEVTAVKKVTTLSLTPAGSTTLTPGQALALKATVAGGQAPSGLVTFVAVPANSVGVFRVLGTAAVLNGVATLNITPADIGNETDTIKVSYAGDANNAGSSLNTTATVNATAVRPDETRAATSTALFTSIEAAPQGNRFVLRAVASDPAATGTYSFFNGQVLVGSAELVNGEAIFSMPVPTNRTAAMVASYSGDQTHAASNANATLVAELAPAAVTMAPYAAGPLFTGGTGYFVIRVEGPYRNGTAAIFENGAKLATRYLTVTDGYLLEYWSNVTLAPGMHQLEVVFTATDNLAQGRATMQVQVVKQSQTTISVSPKNPTLGSEVTLTANVTGSNPSGTVSFYDAYALIGSAKVENGVAQLTVRNNTLSTPAWQAFYSGDVGNAVSNARGWGVSGAGEKAITVATETTLDSEVLATPSGQVQTVRATVSGVMPTGIVTFFNRYGQILGTASLSQTDLVSEGLAVFTLPGYVAGQGVASATYAGDVNNATSVAAAAAAPAPAASLALSSSDALPFQGMPLVLMAGVGGNAPTGMVKFFGADGRRLGEAAVIDGVARLTVSTLPAGKNTISIMYGGDANNAFSAGELVQQVAQSPTSVTLQAAQGTQPQGTPLLLTVSVDRAGAGYAGGSVTFYNGATIIGVANLVNGQAALTLKELPGGANALSARYGGDANNIAANSAVLDDVSAGAPVATRLIFSATPRTLAKGDLITMTAQVVSKSGSDPEGIVTFFDGTEVLGTAQVLNGVATLATRLYRSGNIGPLASYSGDARNATSSIAMDSAYVTVTSNATVAPALTTTASSLSFESPPATVVFGSAATFNVRVAVTNSEHPPTGAVNFFVAGNLVGSARVVNGVATMQYSGFVGGSPAITAVYSGDAYNSATIRAAAPSASVALTPLTINPTLSLSTFNVGEVVNLRLMAEIPYPPGNSLKLIDGNATVDFYLGTTKLGTASVVNGQAVFTKDAKGLAGGPLTAVFSLNGTPILAAGTSAPVQLVRDIANPVRLALTPVAASTVAGESITLSAVSEARMGWAGTVSFFDGDILLGSMPAPEYFTASMVIPNVAAGAHAYRAVYSGNPAGFVAPSYSAVMNCTVAKPAVAMTYSAIPVTEAGVEVSWSGASKFLKVTIFVAGVPAPTGSVVLFNAAKTIRYGTAQVVGGKAIILVPASLIKAVSTNLTVVYSGDDDFAASEKTDVIIYPSGSSWAVPSVDTVVLSSRPDPAGQAGAVELFTLVKGNNPDGTVQFKDVYGNVLGVSAVLAGRASVTVPLPAGGLAGVTASYSGDALNDAKAANYSAPPAAAFGVTNTSLSASAAAAGLDAALVLTARVNGGGASPTGTVSFYDGSILLGTIALQAGVATLATKAPFAGVNHLTAVYSGDAGNAASMSAAVDESAFTTPVSVKMNSVTTPVSQGGPVTLVASISGSVPSGLVTFLSGNTVLGTAVINNGIATLQLARNAFDAGTVSIVASYSGDSANAPTVSAAMQLTVTAGVKAFVIGDSADDRKTRQFLDRDGNVRSTLDAENNYVEFYYDSANRLIKTTAFAAPVTNLAGFALAEQRSGTGFYSYIESFRPTANAAADVNSYRYYDSLGQVVAEVNGEGYLTEYVYDAAGRPVQTIRYARPAAGTVGTSSTLATLRPALHAEDQKTSTSWNLHGLMASQTGADGTVTEYTYDAMDNLVATTAAKNTIDARSMQRRYDTQGRVKAELSAIGSALIVGQQTAAEADAIWAAHGTSYAYDLAGQRISTTDALGHRTVFFSDDEGRLRFAVNAEGEVAENKYDTLGRLSSVTRYASKVDASALAAMNGGLLSSVGNQAAVAALAVAGSAMAAQNSISAMRYDAVGNVVETTDAMGHVRRAVYDAFGATVSETEPGTIGGSDVTTLHTFDRRGLEVATVQRSDKIYVAASAQYDALGRMTRSVDFNGNVSQQAYDRIGQVVTTTDAANGIRRATYDTAGRVITQTDALQNVTTYTYDTAARSVTLRTAEGITSTTTMTRTGQVQSITDGNGKTATYHYDLNGNLLDTVTAEGSTSNTYDAIGRVSTNIDAEGNQVGYTYDAANRLLTRTLDADGLNLTNSYRYDAKGQRISSTDASGLVTVTEFDLNGAAVSQTVDPDGLHLHSSYAHDARGATVSVTGPDDVRTDYVYDDLGRRIRTISDPAGLNLVQVYNYDNNGNVVSSDDAKGARTYYVYDALDRLIYTVDPMGYVRQTVYDAESRIARTITYFNAISVATPAAAITAATITSTLATLQQLDQVQYHVYDKDGRRNFDVDALGGVTAYQYDSNGNVISRLTYAARINMATWIIGAIPVPVVDALRDIQVRTVYDGLNRPVFTIDGTGAVSAMRYDDNGKLLELTTYANTIAPATAATAADIGAAVLAVADAMRDAHTRYVYDSAGRKIWETNSAGLVTGYTYNGAGSLLKRVEYATPIDAQATPDSVQQASGDHVTLIAYDALQRIVAQVDYAGTASRLTYDANGNALTRITFANAVRRPNAGSTAALAEEVVADPARDQIVKSVYDAANREIYRFDRNGVVIAQQFDANGRVIGRTTYATTIPPATQAVSEAVAAAIEAIADSARDKRQRFVYDADGLLQWSVENGRDLTAYAYNSLGEMARRTEYANALTLEQTDFSLSGLTAAAAAATVLSQDGYTVRIFDKADNLIWTVDGTGAATQFTYDVAGNQTSQTIYAQKVVNVTTMSRLTTPEIYMASSPQDVRSFRIYDTANRLSWAIDGMGGVTHYTYDGNDQVVEQVTYANRINMATWVTGAIPVVVADMNDRIERTAYDLQGRPVFNVDGRGQVTAYTYAGNGKISSKIVYATAIPVATAVTVEAIGAALVRDTVHDLRQLFAYDDIDRVILQSDSEGKVKRYSYDSAGNVTMVLNYGDAIAGDVGLASVQAGASDRVNLMAYDADNRLVYQVDDMGRISQRFYDIEGNVIKSVAYATRISRPNATSVPLDVVAIAALVVADPARDRASQSVFDAFGREIYSIDANGAVTAYQYNAMGKVVVKTAYAEAIAVPSSVSASSMAASVAGVADASRDDKIRYLYDQAGQLVSSVNARGDTTAYAYNAAGKVVKAVTYPQRGAAAILMAPDALKGAGAGLGICFDYVYDASNRLAFEVDSANTVTSYQYDGVGNEIKRVVHASRTARDTFLPGIAPVVVVDVARDNNVRTVYDAIGRPVFTVDRDGYVTSLKYDMRNNVIERVTYANPIATATAMTAVAISAAVALVADPARDARTVRVYGEYDEAKLLLWESTGAGKVRAYTYDSDGNLVKQVNYALAVAVGAAPQTVLASATDEVFLTTFDIEHRPLVSVDQYGNVTRFTYDINGNLLEKMSYATRVARPAAASALLDGSFVMPLADVANDHFVRCVFDVAGRELFRIDQYGVVTSSRIDGNSVDRITYATALPADTPATFDALSEAVLLVANSARDRFVRETYNDEGQLSSSTDARGGVTLYAYDAHGNQVQVTSPEGYVTRQFFDCSDRLIYSVNATGSVTSYRYDATGNMVRQVQHASRIAATGDPALVAASADDRINLMAYDANHQLIYAVDGEGTVRKQEFDAAGNMTRLTVYAVKISVAAADAGGGAKLIASLVTPQPNADRVNYQIFDALNRMVYGVDTLGLVQKYTYDAKGNLTQQIAYANSIKSEPAFTDYTVSGLDGRVVPDAVRDRTEIFEHNIFGQVTWHKDALGLIEKTTFSSTGRKESYTDKSGALWQYEYDVPGNLTKETAPAVPGKNGNYQRIVSTVYDALGQLLSRTESGDGDQSVNLFTYDNLGNQTSIDFGKNLGYTVGVVEAQLGDAISSNIAYDRYGHAIKTTDVDGYVSYNVYDGTGQLRFEIDAKGNVTEYARNAFGEVSSLIRYDGVVVIDPANPPGVLAMATKVAALNQATTRALGTVYDHAGRVAEVRQPFSWSVDPGTSNGFFSWQTTRYTYDAFGAVIQTSSLLNPVANTWLVQNAYYDQAGRLSTTVDAAGCRTGYTYDSAGNQTSKLESAVAIAGWTGNRAASTVAVANVRDRITTTTYDLNNRLLRESLGDGANLPNNEHVRVTEYDALNRITLTMAWGPGASDSDTPSRMFYDALGRMTAMIDGSRQIGNGFGLTTYRYNLFGKVVSETQYAQGALMPAQGDQPVPVAPGVQDRTRTVEYDHLGNAIHIVDAAGLSQYVSYNKRGLQTAEWKIGKGVTFAAGVAFGLSSRTYDELGRVLTDSAKSQTFGYNAFGELVRMAQGSKITTFTFDNAGRLLGTNESGVDTGKMYDMLGRVSSVVTSGGQEFGNTNIAFLGSQLTDSNLRRTDYAYDAIGHIITETGPKQGTGLRALTTMVYDRWGNLLSKTEPAGNGYTAPTTTYTYDTQNRVLSESYPKGNGSPGGRVRNYEYSFGAQDTMVMRQIIDRESAAVTGPEANDALHARWRLTTESYTTSGKLLSSVTNGLATERHTYDSFDQMRTDGLQEGSIASYEYDISGHVISVSHPAVEVHKIVEVPITVWGMHIFKLDVASQGSRVLVERYTYDELGYMASSTNGADEVTQYRHDLFGNVIWTDTIGSPPTSGTWDVNGNKLTATDAFGNQASWTYDSYGRVKTATGYDVAVTTYVYDNAGQLYTATQPAKAQVITYHYDPAGRLLWISDGASASPGYPAQGRGTFYIHDVAGNRVGESTTVGGTAYQNNTQVFDAFHQLVSVTAADGVNGEQKITYEYDAFGNRSRFTSAATGKGTDRNQNGYFFFDALNRMTVSGALDAAGTIGAGTTLRAFDETGNLKNTIKGGYSSVYAYDARNRLVSTTINGGASFATSYDAAGRVVEEYVQTEAPPAITSATPMPSAPLAPLAPTDPGPNATQAAKDAYDTQYQKYLLDKQAYDTAYTKYLSDVKDVDDQSDYFNRVRADVSTTSNYERHFRIYNEQGWLLVDQASKVEGGVKSVQRNSEFDIAGHVVKYSVDSYVGDDVRSSYTNTYRTIGAGVVQAASSGQVLILSGDLAGKTGAVASSTLVYDANGYMTGVTYATDGAAPTSGTKKKSFFLDAHGNILLSREESYNAPTVDQHEIIALGELHLRYSTSSGDFTDMTEEQKDGFWDAYNKDAYQSLLTPGGDAAPAPGEGSMTGQVVMVADGDTLSSIALRVYGDASAWYRLADANNIEMETVLKAGQTLLAPAATSDSSKLSFDSGKLVGSTAPNLPPPPPDSKNCIMLLIVVVAVIVACIVAPYMAAWVAEAGMGALATTVVAGALTGAVASLASQGVAIAAGVQDGINWKSVGMGALGGAVAGAMTAVPIGSVGQAVAGSIITQRIGVATGMQEKFNWAAVAGAGVSAAVTQSMTPEGDGKVAPTRGQFAAGFVRGSLAGFAGGLTTDLLTPGKQNWAQIAIGAIGGGLNDGLNQQKLYNKNQAGYRADGSKFPTMADYKADFLADNPLAAYVARQGNLDGVAMGFESEVLNSAYANVEYGDAPENGVAGQSISNDPTWPEQNDLRHYSDTFRFIEGGPAKGNPGGTSNEPGVLPVAIRSDESSPIPQVEIRGKRLTWYGEVWDGVVDAFDSVEDFLSRASIPEKNPAPDNSFAIATAAARERIRQAQSGPPRSYIYALTPAMRNPGWSNSVEQRAAQGVNDFLSVGAHASSEIGGGTRNVKDGDVVKGGARIVGAALSVVPGLPLGKVANLARSEQAILGAELNHLIKTAELSTVTGIGGLSPVRASRGFEVPAWSVSKNGAYGSKYGSPNLDADFGLGIPYNASSKRLFGASSTAEASTIAYRPVSKSSSSILSSEGLARAGQARADLYQAWKADNAGAYASIEEQAAGYRNLISGESPWPEGFTPVNETIPQGARIRMALSPGQPLTSPGGFGTIDMIPNEPYVRNQLAVKYGWKADISGVVEYEVTQPLPVRAGPVGPQIDLGANRYLPGRGSQVNFNIPRTQSRMDYLNVIGFTPFK